MHPCEWVLFLVSMRVADLLKKEQRDSLNTFMRCESQGKLYHHMPCPGEALSICASPRQTMIMCCTRQTGQADSYRIPSIVMRYCSNSHSFIYPFIHSFIHVCIHSVSVLENLGSWGTYVVVCIVLNLPQRPLTLCNPHPCEYDFIHITMLHYVGKGRLFGWV